MTDEVSPTAPQQPPRRWKKSSDRPGDARQALIDAAIELMQRLPTTAIRARDIADRAGVTYGLISYYWPEGGHRQLLVEAFETARAAWTAQLATDRRWRDTWFHSPDAERLLPMIQRLEFEPSFAEAWQQWADPTASSFDRFAELRSDLPRPEAFARWALAVTLGALLHTSFDSAGVSGAQLARLTRVEQLRARREYLRLLDAAITETVTGDG